MSFGDIMQIITKVLWFFATLIILTSSIYFTYKLKGIQFNFKSMFKSIGSNSETSGISNFQTLMLTLAGRIGVGSVAGVSLAIYTGGIGTIFWLIITVFLCATNTFCETILGGIYKEQDANFQYKGGPSYYIKKGLKNKTLGNIYAILIIVGYVGFFCGIQSNTITRSLVNTNIDVFLIATVLSIITFIIIYGGLKQITKFSTVIVPIMTIIYILFAFIVLILNINKIPQIFIEIIKDAFNFKSFFTGFLSGFLIGIQRGIFSNESGIGTGSIVSSTSCSTDIVKQGYIQMLGIYITTFLICISTAIIVLTSNYQDLNYIDMNGIEMTKNAFLYHFGSLGDIVLTLSIILFSFSTIVTAYYYGESCLKYFGNVNSIKIFLLKLATVLIVFVGCIASSYYLWSLVDIIVALLILINVYAIIKLRKEILVYVNKNN